MEEQPDRPYRSSMFDRVIEAATRQNDPRKNEDRFKAFPAGLHYKGLRDDPVKRWIDAGSELICSTLGNELDLPVVPLELHRHSHFGIVLVGPDYGDRSLDTDPNITPTNVEKVRRLCVFEELVLNTDDKPRHLMLDGIEGNEARVVMVDHGHTFHRGSGEPDSIEDLEDWGPALDAASIQGYDYEVSDWSHLQPGIELVQGIGDDQIEQVVEGVCQTVAYFANQAGDDAFLDELPKHRRLWKGLLRIRRDNIDPILRQRFPGLAEDGQATEAEA